MKIKVETSKCSGEYKPYKMSFFKYSENYM